MNSDVYETDLGANDLGICTWTFNVAHTFRENII